MENSVPQRPRREDYTVGWICALPIEMMAAKVMLDESHPPLPQQALADTNAYQLGRVGGHNIVIACLPAGGTGLTSAATVAAHMRTSFPSVECGLMVGIGGGVPRKTRNPREDYRNAGHAGYYHGYGGGGGGAFFGGGYEDEEEEADDVRLGDIVVSQPTGTYGGVVQYDFGKAVAAGRFVRTGQLNRPPALLLTALSNLQAQHKLNGNAIADILAHVATQYPRLRAAVAAPTRYPDLLFEADYDHEGGPYAGGDSSGGYGGAGYGGGGYVGSGTSSSARNNNMCQYCERNRLVRRAPRHADYAAAQSASVQVALAAAPSSTYGAGANAAAGPPPLPSPQPLPPAQPRVHYGLIASGNRVMRHGATRDRVNADAGGGVLCFEMEAAGLMNDFPCLVVRGVCDYADSHKNKAWQEYAALAAAAYARELLDVLPPKTASVGPPRHDAGVDDFAGAQFPGSGGGGGWGGSGGAGAGQGQQNFFGAQVTNNDGTVFMGTSINGGHGGVHIGSASRRY